MKTVLPIRPLPAPVFFSFFVAVSAITATGCQKDLSAAGDVSPVPVVNAADTVAAKSAASLTQTVPFPQNTALGCDFAPDYGQTLIQPQPTSGADYVVLPVNNKNVQGAYLAWPGGLEIDAHTGAINVSRSETGARYAVGFIRAGSTDTCMSYITLGGADYIDSIYSASVSAKTAAPHFDGNVSGSSPCSGPGCKFDYNHVARKQGVYVDEHNGAIDIRNTLHHSIFALMPIDGMYFYTTIQYKANNGSNNAAQSIQVKLIYYNYRSSIPASLLHMVNDRANSINTGTLAAEGVTRPPIIIITRNQ